MKIDIIPVLNDNYAYILQAGGQTAIIDPGEAAPVIAALEKHGLKLDYILNTHHHGDHIAGNAELKQKYGAKIAAPDDARIQGVDIKLSEQTDFSLGGQKMQILETPGHTKTHICLYFPSAHALFTGDTVFSMGCGKLFEGTPQDMWNSFQKILALPDETKIYCGHEYTVQNGRFCRAVEPNNKDIENRLEEAEELRAENKPTIPSTLAQEKKTNIFLRTKNAAEFAALREKKNNA